MSPSPAAPPTTDLRAFFEQHWSVIVSTQPTAVRDGLRAERAYTDRLLRRSAYRSLVEVGCADGSLLLDTAIDHGLAYLGLDLAEGAVAATRAALAGTTGTAALGDICDLTAVPARPALVAFPFNVFGNLPDPQRALAAVAAAGADILLLTYDTGEAATAVRAEYYAACGLPGELVKDSAGVHFRSGAFRSSVYHPPVLSAWLHRYGFQVTVGRYGAVGLGYHGWCGPPSNR